MTPLALILLLAATRVELLNQVDVIPANEWRYHALPLNQQPALVTVHFEVASGPPAVRLLLLQSGDVDGLRSGAPQEPIESTEPAGEGVLRYQVRIPDNYALIIENHGQAPAAVRTRVSLTFPEVKQLSHRRQLTVMAASFLVFFGIVTFSARRLLRAVRR